MAKRALGQHFNFDEALLLQVSEKIMMPSPLFLYGYNVPGFVLDISNRSGDPLVISEA
jgi:hypothetical protein